MTTRSSQTGATPLRSAFAIAQQARASAAQIRAAADLMRVVEADRHRAEATEEQPGAEDAQC